MCCVVKSFTCKVTSYLNRSETKKKTNQRSLGENLIVCLSGRAACFHFNLRYVNIAHSLCDVTQSRILQNMKTSHCYKDHRLNLFFFFFFGLWTQTRQLWVWSLQLPIVQQRRRLFKPINHWARGLFSLCSASTWMNYLTSWATTQCVTRHILTHTHTHTQHDEESFFCLLTLLKVIPHWGINI